MDGWPTECHGTFCSPRRRVAVYLLQHEGSQIHGHRMFIPNSAANSETLFLLRQMLLQEELRNNVETGVIHVMRGVPRAWLEPGKTIRLERAPTYFWSHVFSFRFPSAGGIRMTVTPPQRQSDLHVHLRRAVKTGD